MQAVAAHQTGVASGMNTVMRTIGGALGGQLSATLIADHIARRPADGHRFHRDSFAMATGFLVVCALAGLLIPGRPKAADAPEWEPALSSAQD